ncbi:Uncharacterised protein [Klebsiella pneumoniae subsp. ozaenae]|uniref:Uncharacterized protein n=1 Tax=Klebsiella pneumoniae subsp. ozaenae TaxID=574 RepID=A0A378A659_KLEPO|nr:Uncharacterised protein [Klebsiella pneumoniae subsp. ozaenae]
MTVSTQVSRNEYTGNGATTQYDFTFRILDKSHLLVQTLDTSESIVTLTLGTDYTVTGVNRYNGGEGGSDISAASWLQNLYRAQHAGYAGSQHQEPGGLLS